MPSKMDAEEQRRQPPVYGTHPPTPHTSDRTLLFPARCYYRPRLSSTLEFLILSAVVRVHRDTRSLLLEQIRGFQSGWKPRPRLGRDVTRIPLVRYRYWADPVSRSRERHLFVFKFYLFFPPIKIKTATKFGI